MELYKSMFIILVSNLARYAFFAGVAYSIFYILKRSSWANRKIQAKYPNSKQIISEIKYSIISIFIFAFVGVLIFSLGKMGILQVYTDVSKHGWLYFVASLVVLLLFHDTYFYWSHRALHHPKLIRFHLIHHHSHNTTPFTSFSFHPVEAIVQTGFIFILIFLPVNVYVLAIVMTWQMFFNVLGHLGFEVFSKKFHNSFIGRQFNTVTHHNMHHRYTNQNFGLYFSFWDRIMKTNHKEYEQQYNANAEKMYQS
jgi:Delta7-sterol 5-desaturase